MSGHYPAVAIGEFCRTGAGTTPSRAENRLYYDGGTVPWIKSGELREGRITTASEHVTDRAVSDLGMKIVPSGALLLAMYGATVGRLGILGIAATTNQAVCHIVPDSQKAEVQYLFHALVAQTRSLVAKGVGGAQPNISQEIVRRIQIPLPPLPEQRRIADILDQADTLRTKRRAALAQLDTLTQAIFLEMFGDPISNPKGWPRLRIADIVTTFQGGRSFESAPDDLTPTKFRVLKISAVTGMHFRPKESKPVADPYTPPPEHLVRSGDLLFSRANTAELVGAVAFVEEPAPNLLLPDKLWRFVWRDPSKCDPLFVWSLFQTAYIRHAIEQRATGTSGSMKNISQEKLMGVVTYWPPVEHQKYFADKARHVGQMQVRARASLAQLDALFASLQHRAFRGEL